MAEKHGMVAILHMVLSATAWPGTALRAWCMGPQLTTAARLQEWTDVSVFSAQEYRWPQSHTSHLDALPQDGTDTQLSRCPIAVRDSLKES